MLHLPKPAAEGSGSPMEEGSSPSSHPFNITSTWKKYSPQDYTLYPAKFSPWKTHECPPLLLRPFCFTYSQGFEQPLEI